MMLHFNPGRFPPPIVRKDQFEHNFEKTKQKIGSFVEQLEKHNSIILQRLQETTSLTDSKTRDLEAAALLFIDKQDLDKEISNFFRIIMERLHRTDRPPIPEEHLETISFINPALKIQVVSGYKELQEKTDQYKKMQMELGILNDKLNSVTALFSMNVSILQAEAPSTTDSSLRWANGLIDLHPFFEAEKPKTEDKKAEDTDYHLVTTDDLYEGTSSLQALTQKIFGRENEA